MEIKIPEVGESIHEALISRWHKKEGETIRKGDILCELETDKVNVELPADASGTLKIKIPEGKTVEVGTVIGTIEEGESGGKKPSSEEEPAKKTGEKKKTQEKEEPPEEKKGKTGEAPGKSEGTAAPLVNPAARRLAREKGIDLDGLSGSGRGGRITLEDVRSAGAGESTPPEATADAAPPGGKADESGRTTRRPMTPLRKKIAERLVAVRQQTAMLTTFNEADLSRVAALRRKQGEAFKKKHGVSLGFMSFFVKATVEALKEFPQVNARIDGDEVVEQHFYDIGIAVGSDRGLVVPVLRDADRLDFAAIESGIAAFVERIQNKKITLSELEGGTFTITNGGVYGSLLSTPILNPPQSAVLGMHAIQERPVAREGKVVVLPMMYLALSYDHRLIDGREAVQFLKRIKELIEDPEEMLLEL